LSQDAIATEARHDNAGRTRSFAVMPRVSGVVISALVWLLFIVAYSSLSLADGDSQVQYRFVRRLFGDADNALGYYFGLGLLEAPFYGVGKVFRGLGIHTLMGQPVLPATVALGLGLFTLAAWPPLAAILRGLDLPHPGLVILAAAFGTPFFYYAAFSPGKNHAPDAVLFAVVLYLAYRYFRESEPERWVPFALGAVLGVACTVRYFSGAEAVMLVLFLAWCRRWRHALIVTITATIAALLLLAVPWALDVPVFGGGYAAERVLTFAPLNPLRMLFTNQRGFFVWSPVSALAAVGLVLLFRRRPEHRRFLSAATLMGVGIMAAYAFVPFWTGTFAFSQRFFTPLFPLVAIGLAGLVEAVPRTALAAAAVATAWSIFLALNFVIIGGPQYLSDTRGGASDLALVPFRTHTSIGAYLWGVKHKSNFFD
jgi:hypothetical protein